MTMMALSQKSLKSNKSQFRLFFKFPIGKALELEAWCTEIQEEPNLQVECLQIVDGLRKVNRLKLEQGL